MTQPSIHHTYPLIPFFDEFCGTFEGIDIIENIESYRIHKKEEEIDRWIMLQFMADHSAVSYWLKGK